MFLLCSARFKKVHNDPPAPGREPYQVFPCLSKSPCSPHVVPIRTPNHVVLTVFLLNYNKGVLIGGEERIEECVDEGPRTEKEQHPRPAQTEYSAPEAKRRTGRERRP